MAQHRLVSKKDPRAQYRGWLRNPATGRIFLANHVTARRTDLEQCDGPDAAEPRVASSHRSGRQNRPADPGMEQGGEKAAQEENAPAPETSTDDGDAETALADLLKMSQDTEDKEELKVLGAQIDVELTKAMNVDTMRERIAEQVRTLQEFEG